MKHVYAAVFGLGAFFAMNCGSDPDGGGYSSSSTSSGSTSQSPTESAASADDTTKGATIVVVSGHSFDPPEVHVKAGATVRWTFTSGSHNVVSGSGCTADGAFTSGNVQSSGKFEQTFEKAGSFPYYCDPHCSMGMKGKVIVE